MAAILGRASQGALLKVTNNATSQSAKMSTVTLKMKNLSKASKLALAAAGAVTATGLGMALTSSTKVHALDYELHPPHFPWPHRKSIFSSFDHDSMRRGYYVYKNVCSACHSLEFICYRHLVGEIFTEKEAKAEAADALIWDGPDDEGKMFQRPGKLSDTMPSPYENDEAARAANNGAIPPDLSHITRAREGEEDYVFALLTGYQDAPAGVELGEGQHYNPYFLGGAISMAQALYNEIIEYEDGTPATQSQTAKDVTTFLHWCGEPEHDVRKKYLIKISTMMLIMIVASYVYKKSKWSYIGSQMNVLRKQAPKS